MDETVEYEWAAIEDGEILEMASGKVYLRSKYPGAEIMRLPKPHMSMFV